MSTRKKRKARADIVTLVAETAADFWFPAPILNAMNLDRAKIVSALSKLLANPPVSDNRTT